MNQAPDVDPDSEDPDYDEEEDVKIEIKDNKEERRPEHVPKIGSMTAKNFSKIDRGGIPRPQQPATNNFLRQTTE